MGHSLSLIFSVMDFDLNTGNKVVKKNLNIDTERDISPMISHTSDSVLP